MSKITGVVKNAKMGSFAFMEGSKILSPKSIVEKVSKNPKNGGGAPGSKKVHFGPPSLPECTYLPKEGVPKSLFLDPRDPPPFLLDF